MRFNVWTLEFSAKNNICEKDGRLTREGPYRGRAMKIISNGETL